MKRKIEKDWANIELGANTYSGIRREAQTAAILWIVFIIIIIFNRLHTAAMFFTASPINSSYRLSYIQQLLPSINESISVCTV